MQGVEPADYTYKPASGEDRNRGRKRQGIGWPSRIISRESRCGTVGRKAGDDEQRGNVVRCFEFLVKRTGS